MADSWASMTDADGVVVYASSFKDFGRYASHRRAIAKARRLRYAAKARYLCTATDISSCYEIALLNASGPQTEIPSSSINPTAI